MEELTTYIDGYCERLAPGLWAEPVNTVTNFAFIIAAVIIFARTETRKHPITIVLSILLFSIGVGSLLFHAFANTITSIADVTPILLFTLTFLFASYFYFFEIRRIRALILTLLFFPYAWLIITIFDFLFPWIGSSIGYIPILLLFPIHSVLLWRLKPTIARNLGIAFMILAVSLSFRWLDEPICSQFPLGTHFIWHVLNAVLLAYLIKTLADELSNQSIQNT